MRYFVTGATGFLGGRLIRQLREHGHEVVALVRTLEGSDDLHRLGVELHRGDVTDPDSMRDGMAGAAGVFHLAAWYKLGTDPARAELVNVNGTGNVLRLMRDLAIPRGVYTSTLAVFSDTRGKLVDEDYRFEGRHLTEYDRTKWIAHYRVALPMIREGLPLIIVQPGVVYGPGDHSLIGATLDRGVRGRQWYVPARTAYCWSHVDDTAQGHLLAMQRGTPGESYILAGPVHSLADALGMAARTAGVAPPRVRLPPWLVRTSAVVMGALGGLFTPPPTLHPETLRASAGVTYLGDASKAQRELGYQPRSLEDGLRETLGVKQEG